RGAGPGWQVLQANYGLREPDDRPVRANLRRAFGLRNTVLARGASGFGLPTLLFGSGIVLRWDVLDVLAFADPRIAGTGDTKPVADDVALTFDLLEAGIHPRLVADAEISAPAPDDDAD